MIENIRLSLKGILSHKMRSALTMLGIIIGISSIIAIVSIIQGTSNMLKSSMVGEGTNTVQISFYDKNESWSPYSAIDRGKIEGISSIPQESVDEVNQLDGVVKASPFYYSEYGLSINYNSTDSYGNTYGIEEDYFDMAGLQLKRGRLFTESDYDNKSKVIVLDTSTANTLFGDIDCLGKTVSIRGEMFVVVGIADTPIDYSKIDSLSSYMMNGGYEQSKAYIPSVCWSLVAGYDDIQSLLIKVESADDRVNVGATASEILNINVMNEGYEYKSTSLQEDAEELETITTVISILLVGIASISLLVGGIGVMNIMLVSVTERTKEIGLKKALGAKKSRILAQFLTEAVVLTGIGGLLGVLLGVGLAYVIGLLVQMEIGISVFAIILSVTFSMAVGIVFGIVPSVKASKLDPIVALRYE